MPPKAPASKAVSRRALSEIREQVNLAYYGDPGSAKTTNLVAASLAGPLVLVNAEGGVKKRPLTELGMDLEQVSIYPDPSAGEAISFDGLEQLFWDLKAELQDDPDAVWAVGWDSMTEIQNLLMRDVLAEAREKSESKGKERGRFDTYQEDWGTNTGQMRELLSMFRDLPCHFVATALPRRDVDDDGSVKYGPAVTPALQNDVFAFMDILCHTSEVEVEGQDDPVYVGTFRKRGAYRAKDRFKALPKVLVQPWIPRVVDYINGDLTEQDDPIQQEGMALLRDGSNKRKGPSGRKRGRPTDDADDTE